MALPNNIESTLASDKTALEAQIKKYVYIILKEYPRNGSLAVWC